MFTIHRRPSGDPDKDIIDHVMQVKLAYKDQLTHILQQVQSSNCHPFQLWIACPFYDLKWYLQLPLFLHTRNKHFSLHSICSMLEMSNINPKIQMEYLFIEIRAHTGIVLAQL